MVENRKCPLAVAAEAWPGLLNLASPGRQLSFKECDTQANLIAENLRKNGVEAGDTIVIVASSSAEFILLLFALWRLQAVACPINHRFPRVYQEDLLRSIGCTKIITDQSLSVQIPVSEFRIMPLSELTVSGRGRENADTPAISYDQPATIIFTSGSSARPKGVLHNFGCHIYNALGSNSNLPVGLGDRWLLSLPLYHVGGLAILFRTLLAGAAVVIPDLNKEMATVAVEQSITHLSLVPTQLHRLLAEPGANLTLAALKGILLGGGPTPKHMIESTIENKLPIFCTYGLTEMGSQVTTTSPNATASELATSGRILPYRELQVGHDGRIRVRGETLFSGYVTPTGIEQPFDADGWFETCDLGEIDTSGCLKVFGRIDNAFISGGENIQPELIEAEILALCNAQQVAVVPVEDPEFGKRPVAFVDGKYDPDKVILLLREKLPGFMIPLRLFDWPEAVKGPGMKFNRQELIELANQDLVRYKRD